MKQFSFIGFVGLFGYVSRWLKHGMQTSTARRCVVKKAILTLFVLAFTGNAYAIMINAVPNPGFETVGPNGARVFRAMSEPNMDSAAHSWYHFHPVPNSFTLSELLPSTDPLPGGGGNMLSFSTDQGFFESAGNGLFTTITSPPGLPVGTFGFMDINVADGTTGMVGFVNSGGGFDSGSVTFGPTHGWRRYVFTNLDSMTSTIGFEIFSAGGGKVFVDNVFAGFEVPEQTSLTLDHFKCYQKVGSAQPVTVPVHLRDQFGDQKHVVGIPMFFCNPVEKQHAGVVTPIRNPNAHLTCYQIVGRAPKRTVRLKNQFETRDIKIRPPKLLCVPSDKISWQ